jgi:uncharacterized membrane protein YidH (DUF202 family)
MSHASTDDRRLMRLMYLGMALTAVLMLAPIVDVFTADSIASHVRDTYPRWSERMIHTDRNAIAAWLASIGLLGVGAWYWSIRSVRKHSRRARIVVTSAFSAGLIVVLINLTTGGHGYKQVVPLTYGLLWLLPAAVGTLATVRTWRR